MMFHHGNRKVAETEVGTLLCVSFCNRPNHTLFRGLQKTLGLCTRKCQKQSQWDSEQGLKISYILTSIIEIKIF